MDQEINNLIKKEATRQQEKITLIASENYASPGVRQVLSSCLANKYSEGEPGKRYYQGNEIIDAMEDVVNKRALKVFDLDKNNWHVNCKAVSASIANLAVISGLLEPASSAGRPGQKILAMDLTHGGHLSHGWQLPSGKPIALTAKIFQVSYYGVEKDTEIFDYNKILKIAKREKPNLLISGGTAYARDIDYKKMAEIAHEVGAYYLADVAHEAGLIAGKVLNSPFPYADVVTMSTQKTLRGPRGAIIICRNELKDKIDRGIFPSLQGGPFNNVLAAIGVCLNEATSLEFKKYARQVIKNAQCLAAELKKHGFKITTSGTDKHLFLIDLRYTNCCLQSPDWRQNATLRSNKPPVRRHGGNIILNGQEAAIILDQAGIVCNKNTVPYETGTPMKPSGIRLGTPACTTRGMKEPEMKIIAKWIYEVLILGRKTEDVLKEVKKMTKRFRIK